MTVSLFSVREQTRSNIPVASRLVHECFVDAHLLLSLVKVVHGMLNVRRPGDTDSKFDGVSHMLQYVLLLLDQTRCCAFVPEV